MNCVLLHKTVMKIFFYVLIAMIRLTFINTLDIQKKVFTRTVTLYYEYLYGVNADTVGPFIFIITQVIPF